MRAGRRDVPLTHADKVLFPDDGFTKADLAAYYRDVAPAMVDLVRDRPVSLLRFNAGIAKQGFFQKNVEKGAPDWVKRVRVAKKGGSLCHVLANDAATLVWLANQNCITPHVWLARADRLERPDRMIFDLDPDSPGDFALVRRTARELGDVLREAGVEPFAMTTGSKGIHVVVASAPLRLRRGARRRGGGGREDVRQRPRPDARVLQAQARRAAVRRRQSQRLRGDGRPALRVHPLPAPRSPRRSRGTSCPTGACARSAGRSAPCSTATPTCGRRSAERPAACRRADDDARPATWAQ